MKKRTSNAGMATIESIALITVFTVLIGYGIGVFVAIHCGILNSIAARTYAWETFAHRTNLNYFRDNRFKDADPTTQTTIQDGFRSHAIISENSPRGNKPRFWATERYLAAVEPEELLGRNDQVHASLTTISKRDGIGVNPIWIKTSYGICLNAECGE